MSSYADPGFDGYVVLYCTCLGCIVLYCKYRNTAVVLEPLGRGLGVNGGWNETDFLDACTTQHFSFYRDICAKHLGGWIKTTRAFSFDNGVKLWDVCTIQRFSFYSSIRAKHLGGRIQNTEIQMLSLRPSGSQYSLAVRFTAKNGGYPGDEEIRENRLFTWKMVFERHKNCQIGITISPGLRGTCQNFF